MKIKHEHIESVLLALAAEKGQAWVANEPPRVSWRVFYL